MNAIVRVGEFPCFAATIAIPISWAEVNYSALDYRLGMKFSALQAFREARVAADEGMVANVELRYIVPQTTLPGEWMLMGFVDANGIGMKWVGYKGVKLRTSLAWSGPERIQADASDRRLYMQMSMGF